jgi:hypothetical protein
VTESKHAIFAPSSAERWLSCPGSVVMERGLPDEESEYAIEGTAAHEYAALWLSTRLPPILPWKATNGFEFRNDEHEFGAVIDAIRDYVDEIKKLSEGHTLLVEQTLPIGHITFEKDASGTGDAIILHADGETLEVSDLKFGMGVKVRAKENKQMMLYALGALHQFVALGDFKKVVMRIHQPRLDHLDEWECSVNYLLDWATLVRAQARKIWKLYNGEIPFDPEKHLNPSEEACRWCKAKATCPALAKHTLETIAEDFVDTTKNPVAKLNPAIEKLHRTTNQQLSWFMQNLGLIEDWCMAVRAKAEGELLAGHDVPGFKVVAGKKGARKWDDEKLVEEELKNFPKDKVYKSKLISPTEAEKLFKKIPEVWARLMPLYSQADGAPSVAPSTDPRPALPIGAVEDDFEVIENKG